MEAEVNGKYFHANVDSILMEFPASVENNIWMMVCVNLSWLVDGANSPVTAIKLLQKKRTQWDEVLQFKQRENDVENIMEMWLFW